MICLVEKQQDIHIIHSIHIFRKIIKKSSVRHSDHMIINGSFGFLKSDTHHLYSFLKWFASHNLIEFSTYPEDNILLNILPQWCVEKSNNCVTNSPESRPRLMIYLIKPFTLFDLCIIVLSVPPEIKRQCWNTPVTSAAVWQLQVLLKEKALAHVGKLA